MESTVNGVPVHFVDHGGGTPILALHGVGVDHRELAGSLEPIFAGRPGYRRIYPDLPGMGRTPAPETVNGSDDVVELLLGLVDTLTVGRPFLVVGQSYGGYLARAIANRRPAQTAGLALICPLLGGAGGGAAVPEHVVLHASGDLLEHYPRATFAVLDRAGHALPHEQQGLLAALLGEWLHRVREQLAVRP